MTITKPYFVGLFIIVLGYSLFSLTSYAENESKEKTDVSTTDSAKGVEPTESIDAFPGMGSIDRTDIPSKHERLYKLTTGSFKAADGTRVSTVEFEMAYGVDLYGRSVELHCSTPWSQVSGRDDDGNNYRNSGFVSFTCGAITQIYNGGDKNNITATIAMAVQSPKTIGHQLPDADPYYHVVIPLTALKELYKGDLAIVGTVAIDHSFGGGNEFLYGTGIGKKLNDSNSLSGSVVRSNRGEVTTDVVLAHQSAGSNKVLYLRLFDVRGGSELSSKGRGAEVGIEIELEPRHSGAPAFFGLKRLNHRTVPK